MPMGCSILSYRLTPGVHYPVPIEESTRVARYVMDNYQEFSIDPNQLFLCGDSAGKIYWTIRTDLSNRLV